MTIYGNRRKAGAPILIVSTQKGLLTSRSSLPIEQDYCSQFYGSRVSDKRKMKPLAIAADNVLAPIKVKARIQSIDVIRGLSILGILAVNADGFWVPTVASLKPLIWPFPNQCWTATSYWVMAAFFHEKFVAYAGRSAYSLSHIRCPIAMLPCVSC